MTAGAGDGIRTREPLRDGTLNPAPLTRLGNPRALPDYPATFKNFGLAVEGEERETHVTLFSPSFFTMYVSSCFIAPSGIISGAWIMLSTMFS